MVESKGGWERKEKLAEQGEQDKEPGPESGDAAGKGDPG